MVCVVEDGSWSDITNVSTHPWTARIVFLTKQQADENDGHDFAPEPELQTRDDSDEHWENRFVLSVGEVLAYAIERGYLDTLDEARRTAIKAQVRIEWLRP